MLILADASVDATVVPIGDRALTIARQDGRGNA